MKIGAKSTRFRERIRLKIPLEVSYTENDDKIWSEQTEIEEATLYGVGFNLPRPVETNRLIHLKMPLPKQLRLFDFAKGEYDVWGVVRYVRLLEPERKDRINLKIGAAFIGNHPPKSFLQNPATLYDLTPILPKQTFWHIREIPRLRGPFFSPVEERRQIEIEILLETIGENGRITAKYAAKTENISESGMALRIGKNFAPTKFVLIRSADEKFALLAVVRGLRPSENSENLRLHLEFISGKWIFEQ